MDGDFRDAIASALQPKNQLENSRGKNDEVSRGVQKAVETGTGEVRVAEVEGGRSKGRNREETRRER